MKNQSFNSINQFYFELKFYKSVSVCVCYFSFDFLVGEIEVLVFLVAVRVL